MEAVTLGKTGLKVTKVGLGLAALGRPGYINIGRKLDLGEERSTDKMREASHRVLDAAWENGVRYFDVARSYGKSELFLAEWLKKNEIPPGQLTIGSKWGYVYTAAWKISAEKHEIKYHTLENFRRQKDESLNLLGDYLNIYQIHSATLQSGVLDDPEILSALGKLRSDDIKIGLSLSGPSQAETLYKALEVKIDGIQLFDTVQATWNLLEPSVGKALKEAKSFGWGVIIKEALANGRLVHLDLLDQKAMTAISEQISTLRTSADAFAMACTIHQDFADIVLSGAATIGQLESNLRALEISGCKIPNIAEKPEDYWDKRSRLEWN